MKLAFLTATFPSLTETFIYRGLKALAASDRCDVQVLAIKRPTRPMEIGDKPPAPVHYLRPDRVGRILAASAWCALSRPLVFLKLHALLYAELARHPLSRWCRLTFHLMAGIYVGWTLKKEGVSCIHAHFSSSTTIALFCHLSSGIPFTYAVIANDDLFSSPSPFFEAKARHASRIVCENVYNQRHFNLLTHHRYREKVRVVYHGLNPGEFSDIPARNELNDPPAILSVGTMSGFKGYPTVLEALRLLKEKGLAFTYRIIGGGGANEAETLRSLANEYGVGDSVEFAGACGFDTVKSSLAWCDMLVMNSEIHAGGLRDSLPNVIKESMAARRLVIATYVSDIPNIIRHGETGYLVPEQNPQALAETIEYTLAHRDEAGDIVERAHRLAVRKFDAEANASQLLDIVSSVTSASP